MAQVIDASVAIAWCATTQATALTDAAFEQVAEDGGHVPAPFWFEVLHGLTKLERRGLVGRPLVDQFVGKLSTLALTIHRAATAEEMLHLHLTARRYALNIYDASYLSLALHSGLPLATRDHALASAAEKAGATLFVARK